MGYHSPLVIEIYSVSLKEMNVPKIPDSILYFFPKAEDELTGKSQGNPAVIQFVLLSPSIINSLLIKDTFAISGRIHSETLETD